MIVVIRNYTNDYDIKCSLKNCNTFPAITDSERGEVFCGNCGTVLLEKISEPTHENNRHNQEEFMKLTRTGPATSLTMHDRGLSTTIGVNKDATGKALPSKTKYEFNRLRAWDQRSKSRSTFTLSKAFTLMNAMKGKLGIPENIVEAAAHTYRKVVNAKITRGRTIASLVSASLYAACRENNIPRTLEDIAKAGNVEKSVLSRDFRTIVKKLELNVNQYNTTSFISKISNDMKLKEKTKRDAFDILKRCEKENMTAGKHPVALAAASLRIACTINGEKISQRKISMASGISDVTIRNRSALIRKMLKIDRQEQC